MFIIQICFHNLIPAESHLLKLFPQPDQPCSRIPKLLGRPRGCGFKPARALGGRGFWQWGKGDLFLSNARDSGRTCAASRIPSRISIKYPALRRRDIYLPFGDIGAKESKSKQICRHFGRRIIGLPEVAGRKCRPEDHHIHLSPFISTGWLKFVLDSSFLNCESHLIRMGVNPRQYLHKYHCVYNDNFPVSYSNISPLKYQLYYPLLAQITMRFSRSAVLECVSPLPTYRHNLGF